MAKKAIICVKDGKWFAKTPKPGMEDKLKETLIANGYVIKKTATVPSMATLEKWTGDSVCKSLMGETIEHDGHDKHGSPSWTLHLGLI